jgi:dihydroxyacetone kinase-like protein
MGNREEAHANPSLVRDGENGRVKRRAEAPKDRVGIVSGGGSSRG